MPDPRRAALLATLAAHRPDDDEERAAVRRLRALLAAPEDPFVRTTLPAHVTGSAVVQDPMSGAVLLHLHRRLDRWLQPGGHLEPGERPDVAARRETREETGIDAQHPPAGPLLLHVDEHPGPDGHVHLDLRYLLLTARDTAPAGAGETTGDGPGPTLRWCSIEEAARLTDRSLARALGRLPG